MWINFAHQHLSTRHQVVGSIFYIQPVRIYLCFFCLKFYMKMLLCTLGWAELYEKMKHIYFMENEGSIETLKCPKNFNEKNWILFMVRTSISNAIFDLKCFSCIVIFDVRIFCQYWLDSNFFNLILHKSIFQMVFLVFFFKFYTVHIQSNK